MKNHKIEIHMLIDPQMNMTAVRLDSGHMGIHSDMIHHNPLAVNF
jgi:hypothetical protein